MAKYKILVYPNGDKSGCAKYRCIDPHVFLQKKYNENYEIDILYDIDFNNKELITKYDMVFFHRGLDGNLVKTLEILDNLHSWGIKTILDLDDWVPGPDHPLYHLVRVYKTEETTINIIKKVNYVSVATKSLYNKIKGFNKNVFILPNGIDLEEPQFKNISKSENNRVRIGYLAGSSHLKDLQAIDGFANVLKSERDKLQFVLCGYDLRGYKIVIDPITKQQREEPLKPTETVWYDYEKIFTDNYKLINDPKYISYLEKYENFPYDDKDQPYRRVWTKPVSSYAMSYKDIDISLAPLVENTFNSYKSNLKMLEAGAHKTALICQNFEPYIHDGVNGKNCILIDSRKNHKDWHKAMKKLINDEQLRNELGENLHQLVKEKYSLDVLTETRQEVYSKILNK